MTQVVLPPPPTSVLRSGDPHALQMHLQRLARVVGGYNYRYSSEAGLHETLGKVLTAAHYEFEHERALDKQNRADFWVGGLVIEVKVDGSLGAALQQVSRYIHLPEVTGVLLASTERWADQVLVNRPAWEGKPFQMVRLWRQAL